MTIMRGEMKRFFIVIAIMFFVITDTMAQNTISLPQNVWLSDYSEQINLSWDGWTKIPYTVIDFGVLPQGNIFIAAKVFNADGQQIASGDLPFNVIFGDTDLRYMFRYNAVEKMHYCGINTGSSPVERPYSLKFELSERQVQYRVNLKWTFEETVPIADNSHASNDADDAYEPNTGNLDGQLHPSMFHAGNTYSLPENTKLSSIKGPGVVFGGRNDNDIYHLVVPRTGTVVVWFQNMGDQQCHLGAIAPAGEYMAVPTWRLGDDIGWKDPGTYEVKFSRVEPGNFYIPIEGYVSDGRSKYDLSWHME